MISHCNGINYEFRCRFQYSMDVYFSSQKVKVLLEFCWMAGRDDE